jgi:hypothetical protein
MHCGSRTFRSGFLALLRLCLVRILRNPFQGDSHSPVTVRNVSETPPTHPLCRNKHIISVWFPKEPDEARTVASVFQRFFAKHFGPNPGSG